MFEIRQYRVALMDQSAVYRLKGWVGGLIFPPAGILSHGGLSDMTGLDVEPIDLSDGLPELEELQNLESFEPSALSGELFDQDPRSSHGFGEDYLSDAGGERPDLSGPSHETSLDQGVVQSTSSNLKVSAAVWNSMVAASYGQYRMTDESMKLPWETGVCADIFKGDCTLKFPAVAPFSLPSFEPALDEPGTQTDKFQFALSTGVCYVHAVSDMKDLDYFDEKKAKMEQACGKWMNQLSCNWEASNIGLQLCLDLRADPTGHEASETLRACFGTKSPNTILKRAATMRKFMDWHYSVFESRGVHLPPMPLVESDVWAFFQFLRQERMRNEKGFTTAATFLETVRFCKFTIGLHGCDQILNSGRLLGFAAIERREKGPSRQAPILELAHLKKLHEVLSLGTDPVDRLGAGAMLICIYGRARWSDLRFVHHVEVEQRRNGALVLYTREHKTSEVGLRREQYLPLVVPWEGVVSEDWLSIFLKVYEECGLNIQRVPLGPLVPAPKVGGGFCARPLSAQEASKWLKLLLAGLPMADQVRSHSLKATLLNWSARAGLDKEIRAVLGHHSSALHGSDIVYSRELQTRPLRKLQMLLKSIRIGLNLEDLAAQGTLASGTPGPLTPLPNLFTPAPRPSSTQFFGPPHQPEEAVETAVELVTLEEEHESVKEEFENQRFLEQQAGELSICGEAAVRQGSVQIDSSSESSDGSSSEGSSSECDIPSRDVDAFRESAPVGFSFFRHSKSARLHKVKLGGASTACGRKLNENFKQLPEVLHEKHPKCLICFPGTEGRLRTRDDVVERLDLALKRVRR